MEAAQQSSEAAAALDAAVATAQWVDTTAAAPADAAAPETAADDSAGDAALTPGPAQQPESGPYHLESAFEAAAQTPEALTPEAAAAAAQKQHATPGTQYFTPVDGGTAQAARAAAAGPLGHMSSLGAWLARGASSHASDTTGKASCVVPALSSSPTLRLALTLQCQFVFGSPTTASEASL